MASGDPFVEVTELLGTELSDLHLRVLCGSVHLDHRITHPRVQKPGLAFAGYYKYIKPGRVQIIGESETEYLKTLAVDERRRRFRHIVDLPVPVFVITKGIEPFPTFHELCREKEVPILGSTSLSSTVINRISFFLEDHLVPGQFRFLFNSRGQCIQRDLMDDKSTIVAVFVSDSVGHIASGLFRFSSRCRV